MYDTRMIDVATVGSTMDASLGYTHTLKGDTFRDDSTVIVCPTRGMIHYQVVNAWNSLQPSKNNKRAFLFCTGHEVGRAYTDLVKYVLNHAQLSQFKYLMTLEDDNIPPADAHTRLLERISGSPYDAVSALYYSKEVGLPMAFGYPERFKEKFDLEFSARDVTDAVKNGDLMEVNGIAMGCTIYKMDLFRQIEPPWFVTVNELIETGDPNLPIAAVTRTQDLSFCERARWLGKRFAVDCSLRVGHIDVKTGKVY